MQENFISYDAVGGYLYIRESLLLPKTAYGIADIGSGHFVNLSDIQPRNAQKVIIVVVFYTVNNHSAQFVALVIGGIIDIGCNFRCVVCLCLHTQRCSEGEQQGQDA